MSDDKPQGWRGIQPTPELWKKLRPLANEMRGKPTPAEDGLWQRLRRCQVRDYRFRRQHAIGRFIVDFYCPEAYLIVEVDGPIHQYTPEEDAVRQEFLESLGLKVIRFTNEEVFAELQGVLEHIAEALQTPLSPTHDKHLAHGGETATPSPSPMHGGGQGRGPTGGEDDSPLSLE